MDLTEEKVSFDQMSTVVSELKQEISGLKTLARTLIDAAGTAPKDAWMNIDELRASDILAHWPLSYFTSESPNTLRASE